MGNANQYYTDVNVPDESQLTVDPNELRKEYVAGNLNPSQIGAGVGQIGSNAMADVQGSSAGQQAQLGALGQIQDLARNGGLNATDQAALASARNTTNAQNKANQSAILQNFSQQGRGGSGAQLAAQLESQQGTANQMADLGQQTAGGAQQRAIQAMMESGRMGSDLNNQVFGQNAQKAQAQNAINQFNAQNSLASGEFNANSNNQAQMFNIGNAQNVANANTQMYNNNKYFNTQAAQQIFQDLLSKASAQSGTDLGQQQIDNAQKQAWMAMIGSILGSGSSAAGAYFGKSAKGGKVTDNYADDNIPITVSKGETVIPREVLAKGDKAVLEFIHAGKTDKELFDPGRAFEQLTKGKPSVKLSPQQIKQQQEAFKKLSALFKG